MTSYNLNSTTWQAVAIPAGNMAILAQGTAVTMASPNSDGSNAFEFKQLLTSYDTETTLYFKVYHDTGELIVAEKIAINGASIGGTSSGSSNVDLSNYVTTSALTSQLQNYTTTSTTGELTSLTTTDKSSIVSAINETYAKASETTSSTSITLPIKLFNNGDTISASTLANSQIGIILPAGVTLSQAWSSGTSSDSCTCSPFKLFTKGDTIDTTALPEGYIGLILPATSSSEA